MKSQHKKWKKNKASISLKEDFVLNLISNSLNPEKIGQTILTPTTLETKTDIAMVIKLLRRPRK